MGIAYSLRDGGNGVTDEVAEKPSSEADRTISYLSEFIVECVLQLGPQGDSIGMALVSSSIVHRSMGVEGINPGLSVFGRWRAIRRHNRRSLRAWRVIGNHSGRNPPSVTVVQRPDC